MTCMGIIHYSARDNGPRQEPAVMQQNYSMTQSIAPVSDTSRKVLSVYTAAVSSPVAVSETPFWRTGALAHYWRTGALLFSPPEPYWAPVDLPK